MKFIKTLLRNWVLKDVLCSVDPLEVLMVSKTGIVQLNGEQLGTDEMKQLKAEVKALKEFHVWRILQETVRQKAIEKAVLQSTDFEQVLAGKMLLHALGLFNSIVEVIDTYKLK